MEFHRRESVFVSGPFRPRLRRNRPQLLIGLAPIDGPRLPCFVAAPDGAILAAHLRSLREICKLALKCQVGLAYRPVTMRLYDA